HAVVPLAYDDGLDQSLEDEGVLLCKGFGGVAGSEDRHIATIGEWADADDLAPGHKGIHHGLVSGINGHDGVHGRAGRLTDDNEFHGASSFAITPDAPRNQALTSRAFLTLRER